MIRPDLYKPNADGRFRQIFIRNTLFNQSARKLNLNISFFILQKTEYPILKSFLERMSTMEQKVSSMERSVVTDKSRVPLVANCSGRGLTGIHKLDQKLGHKYMDDFYQLDMNWG